MTITTIAIIMHDYDIDGNGMLLAWNMIKCSSIFRKQVTTFNMEEVLMRVQTILSIRTSSLYMHIYTHKCIRITYLYIHRYIFRKSLFKIYHDACTLAIQMNEKSPCHIMTNDSIIIIIQLMIQFQCNRWKPGKSIQDSINQVYWHWRQNIIRCHKKWFIDQNRTHLCNTCIMSDVTGVSICLTLLNECNGV